MAVFIVKMESKDIVAAIDLWLSQRGLKLKEVYAINASKSQSIHPGQILSDLEMKVILEEIPKLEGSGPYR